MATIKGTWLADFGTKETMSFIETVRISSDFVQLDPRERENNKTTGKRKEISQSCS